MAQVVHTEFGPGEIVASETVRGRTRHKVAGQGFEAWIDEAKLGNTRIADMMTGMPPMPGAAVPNGTAAAAQSATNPAMNSAGMGGNSPGGPMGGSGETMSVGGNESSPTNTTGTTASRYDGRGELGGNEYDPHGGGDGDFHAPYDPQFDPSVGGPGSFGPDDDGSHRDFSELSAPEAYPGAGYPGPTREPNLHASPYDEPTTMTDDERAQMYQQYPGMALDAGHTATRYAWAPLDTDNSVDLPYDPTPQYPAIPGDTESTLQPIHQIDADERLSPADSITFDSRETDEGDPDHVPGPNPDLFAKSAGRGDYLGGDDNPYLNQSGGNPDWNGYSPDPDHGPGPEDLHADWAAQHTGPDGDSWEHEGPHYQGPMPSQDFLDANGGEDPHGGMDEMGVVSPYREGGYHYAEEGQPTNLLDTNNAEAAGGGKPAGTEPAVTGDKGGEKKNPGLNDLDKTREKVEGAGHAALDLVSGADQWGLVRGAAFIPLLMEALPALAGAGEAAGAAGAAAGAGEGLAAAGAGAGAAEGAAGAAEGGGLGDTLMGAGRRMLPGGHGGDDQDQQHGPSGADAWGLVHDGSVNSWLASKGQPNGGVGAGLSDRYIDVTASADYHSDPIAQFRHDPDAYISRIGHVMDEESSPEMEHYGQLVEANAHIREAAWKDVRTKAMRLRREGHVHVKDIGDDRIYASVQGDHGTYDVMIKKGGAFGGFGGGHSISNWRCSCEWGRWAFKRQHTFVGRLCSHGYASYMEMQSAHTKNRPRQQKLNRPYRKRADALQNGPQRLVPELHVNDTEDSQQFLDVTKDERKDVGPDGMVSDKDIVHFARLMARCEAKRLPYPRQLIAFLVRHAEDEQQSDWKIDDASDAAKSLDEVRDWADTPAPEDYGHMEDRNDRIRDAIEEGREKGVDVDQFVASLRRTADDKKPGYTQTQDGGRTIYRQDGGNTGYSQEGDKYTPVKFNGEGSQGNPGNKYDMDANTSSGGAFTQSKGGTGVGGDLYRRENGDGGIAVKDGDARGVAFTNKDGKPNDFNYNGSGDDVNRNMTQFLQAPKTNGDQAAAGGAGGIGGAGAQGAKPVGDDRQQAVQQNRDINTPGDQSTNGQQAPGPTNPKGGTGTAGSGGGANAGTGMSGKYDAETGDYTVGQGDTLSGISNQYGGGQSYQDIAKNNGTAMSSGTDLSKNMDLLHPGDTLKGVGKPAAPPADSPADSLAKGGIGNAGVQPGMSGDTTPPAIGGAGTTPPADAPPVKTDAAIPPAAGDASGAAQSIAPPAPAQPKTDTTTPLGNAGVGPKQVTTSVQAFRRKWLTADAQPGSAKGGLGNTDAAADQDPGAAKPASAVNAAPAAPAKKEETAAPAEAKPGGMDMSNIMNTVGDIAGPIGSAASGLLGGGLGSSSGGLGGGLASGLSGLAGGLGGASGGLSGLAGGLGGALSGIGSALGGILGSRQDAEDYLRYAYPNGVKVAYPDAEYGPGSHKPFAGSGPMDPLEFSTSEEYADKARKDHDDVTNLQDHNVNETDARFRNKSAGQHRMEDASADYLHPQQVEDAADWLRRQDRQDAEGYAGPVSHRAGISRAGNGPRRTVTPTVVREQRLSGSRHMAAVPDEFDPLAERTAASFGDPYSEDLAAIRTASNEDFVAAFQREAGAALMSNSGGGGGQYDDFSSSPAVREAMLRTAGRNYSLAEQNDLIREGDIGGAGNLSSLNLKGTHYEADNSMNSVGLW